jgi:IPT/TIG domain
MLLPMHRRDWRNFGCDFTQTAIHFQTWVVQGFRSDHTMVWAGHFEDRDDADEFLFAIYANKLRQDRYLQRLPIYCRTFHPSNFDRQRDPNRHPFDHRQAPIILPDGFDPELLEDHSIMYNVVSNIGIGPSSGAWGAPGDCWGVNGRAGEFIDAIAPGGGGASGTPGTNLTGGSGGGFATRVDMAMTPGGQYGYGVGSGGVGVYTVGNVSNGGNGSAHTWFWQQVNPGLRALIGYGGNRAEIGYSLAGPAGGGADAGNWGRTGGRGGNFNSAAQRGSIQTGAGGSAGPNGDGSAGGDNAGVAGGGAGGNGNGNQIGGTGHNGGSAAAGNWYGPWGPAGGAGSTLGGNGIVGGNGGNYGGGGGSAMNNGSSTWAQTSGYGGAGLLVIRYEPQYAPTINWISPNSGPTAGGQVVRINGSFTEVSSANIGGAPLTGMSWNGTDVYGTTSAGGAGTYNVNVYRNNGPSPGVGGSLYTYVNPPSVSSCAPASGPTTPGNAVLVVITGANMSGVSAVSFGGVAASPIAVINSTTVHAWAPAHAAGAVNVVVTNTYGSGTGTNVFTYVTPPSLSAIAPQPAIGLIFGGTDIALTGANLAGTTSVKFGGAEATNVVVVNANTVTCRTPAHDKGLVDVSVTNAYGTATLAGVFTYLLPASGFNMPMMGI